MRHALKTLVLIISLIVSLGWFSLASAAAPNAVTIDSLNDELAQLKNELPTYTAFDTPLAKRSAYVKRIIELMAKIAAEEETNSNSQTQLGEGDKSTLILDSIYYGDKLHPYAGYQETQCPVEQCNKGLHITQSLHVGDYPSVIQLGDPFDFKATFKQSFVKPAGVLSGFENGHTINTSAKLDF